jgi:putative tryptophan/tyrosine transport system substrate-binding protein
MGRPMLDVRRHEFIAALGGAAAMWPLAARAEQHDRVRRIGVLMLYAENDPAGQLRATAFRRGLNDRFWHQSHIAT